MTTTLTTRLETIPLQPVLLPPGWRIVCRLDGDDQLFTVPAVALVACQTVRRDPNGKEVERFPEVHWRFAEVLDSDLALEIGSGFGVLPPNVPTPEGVDDDHGVAGTLRLIEEHLRLTRKDA